MIGRLEYDNGTRRGNMVKPILPEWLSRFILDVAFVVSAVIFLAIAGFGLLAIAWTVFEIHPALAPLTLLIAAVIGALWWRLIRLLVDARESL
jgi:hypothetical protein